MSLPTPESKIAFLQRQIGDYPHQRENIEAIIRYYQEGARLPTPVTGAVYSYKGEAKIGTWCDMTNDYAETKTFPWYDVCPLASSPVLDIMFLRNTSLIEVSPSLLLPREGIGLRETRKQECRCKSMPHNSLFLSFTLPFFSTKLTSRRAPALQAHVYLHSTCRWPSPWFVRKAI